MVLAVWCLVLPVKGYAALLLNRITSLPLPDIDGDISPSQAHSIPSSSSTIMRLVSVNAESHAKFALKYDLLSMKDKQFLNIKYVKNGSFEY